MWAQRFGSLNRGVVVTSGTFTNDAREFASGNMIRLIDGDELATLVRSLQKPTKAVDKAVATPRAK